MEALSLTASLPVMQNSSKMRCNIKKKNVLNELILKKTCFEFDWRLEILYLVNTELRFHEKYAWYGNCVVYNSHVRCSLALYRT